MLVLDERKIPEFPIAGNIFWQIKTSLYAVLLKPSICRFQHSSSISTNFLHEVLEYKIFFASLFSTFLSM